MFFFDETVVLSCLLYQPRPWFIFYTHKLDLKLNLFENLLQISCLIHFEQVLIKFEEQPVFLGYN